MKLAPPGQSNPNRTIFSVKIPYYSQEYADNLWEDLQKWRRNGEPEMTWNAKVKGRKFTTLKAILYGAHRFLKEQGTPEQMDLACKLSLYSDEEKELVILGYARIRSVEPLHGDMNSSGTTPSAAEAQQGASRKSDEIETLKKDLVDWMSSEISVYDGKDKDKRPRWSRVCSLNKDDKREIEQIIQDAKFFMTDISIGYNGVVRVYSMSEDELRVKESL